MNVLNWFPHGFFTTGPEMLFCSLFDGKVCEYIIQSSTEGDITTDDMTRRNVFLSQLPSGSGAYNNMHYGQLVHTEKEAFRRFDYGSDDLNMQHYNQTKPPDYDLSLLDFPLAVFSGDLDKLADPKDVAWLVTQLEPTLIFNEQYHLGHLGFAIGKDMSWLPNDAMPLIAKYNPA